MSNGGGDLLIKDGKTLVKTGVFLYHRNFQDIKNSKKIAETWKDKRFILTNRCLVREFSGGLFLLKERENL